MLNVLREFNPRNLSPERWLGTPRGIRIVRQVFIVLATLLLAYYLGRHPSLGYGYIVVILVVLWALFLHPEWGILGLILAALVIPFEIGTGTQSPLNAAFIGVPVLAGLWLIEMARSRAIQIAPSSTSLPLVGFVVTASISFIVGYLPWNVFAQLAPVRAQLGAWGIFAFSAGAFFLAANRIRSVVWLKRMVWLFLLIAGIYILNRFFNNPGNYIGRFFPFGTDGSLFWIWFVVLAAGQALFNNELKWRWRVLLGGLVVVTFKVALTGESLSWASGWVPALVGLGLLIWLRWPRAAIGLALAAALVLLLNNSILQRYLIDSNQYSIETRGAALKIVLEIISVNPLLGVGPANYYYYTPLYPILGYYVRFNSHNNYVDILAQTGLVGGLFFAWFMLATSRVGWKLRNKFKDGFARAYIYSCLAGLVASLVASALGDWLLPFVYNIGINGFRASILGWLFLGGLVALEQISKAQTDSTALTPAA
jgi:O-antigen ligase